MNVLGVSSATPCGLCGFQIQWFRRLPQDSSSFFFVPKLYPFGSLLRISLVQNPISDASGDSTKAKGALGETRSCLDCNKRLLDCDSIATNITIFKWLLVLRGLLQARAKGQNGVVAARRKLKMVELDHTAYLADLA